MPYVVGDGKAEGSTARREKLGAPIYGIIRLVTHLGFGWPAYLLAVSHQRPSSARESLPLSLCLSLSLSLFSLSLSPSVSLPPSFYRFTQEHWGRHWALDAAQRELWVFGADDILDDGDDVLRLRSGNRWLRSLFNRLLCLGNQISHCWQGNISFCSA